MGPGTAAAGWPRTTPTKARAPAMGFDKGKIEREKKLERGEGRCGGG